MHLDVTASKGSRTLRLALTALLVCSAALVISPGWAMAQTTSGSIGELDCNGDSPFQHSVRSPMNCTDIRGFRGVFNDNTWDSRFYDNSTYIGHDEPDMTFLSNEPGTGNNVTWSERIPYDPKAAPTDSRPGHDVSHYFELTPAPWFSMAMCDPNSYPQAGCTSLSDSNAPTSSFNGGGSAFMEMQLYPPGFPPFADATSCDDSHWCAALTIDSLECTYQFATCNGACEEPVNFAYIQHDGVPTGPPSPQDADLTSFTPNSETLLMNPGDMIKIHMWDAPAPGGGSAFKVQIVDETTHQSGWMQASAANGFQNTSIDDCSGTPFNFEPEYNTAAQPNIVPWAALATNISTEFETGHFEPCSSITDAALYPLSSTITDTFWQNCHGPYEETAAGGDGGNNWEVSDALCYPKGDTHGALNTAPDEITACLDNFAQNGDLDFDGTPYWPEWPVGKSATDTLPGSFVESLPRSGNKRYSQYFVQSDLALSESTCPANSTQGCAIPAPNSPGKFYPYWSRVSSGNSCVLEFGNVSSGAGVNDLGQDAQYGSDQLFTLGYPEFEGPVLSNKTC
jgi:hypothetical protein